MSQKKALLLLFLFLIIVLNLSACNLTVVSKTQPPALKIVYDPWPGFLPLVIAQEKGFFRQQGVKVETVLTENSATKIPDFTAGKYDGITLALGSVVTSNAANSNIRIILGIDRSDGADAVISQPQIQTVADLKGKAIATRLGGFGELFIKKMLEINKMNLNDITLLNARGEQIPELVQSGKTHAGNTWEPFLSKAIAAGLRVLFTSKQTPGLIPDVMVFQASVLRERPDDVRAFIRAWFQAVDYWKANPKEGNALIANALKLKPETISLTGVKLLTLKDNKQAFIPGTNTESLHYTTQLYSDFFAQSNSLNSHPDGNQLLDPSFLQ
ncbi:MAG: ABC transporter substrate-binding protein [Potamolinea sp.]